MRYYALAIKNSKSRWPELYRKCCCFKGKFSASHCIQSIMYHALICIKYKAPIWIFFFFFFLILIFFLTLNKLILHGLFEIIWYQVNLFSIFSSFFNLIYIGSLLGAVSTTPLTVLLAGCHMHAYCTQMSLICMLYSDSSTLMGSFAWNVLIGQL